MKPIRLIVPYAPGGDTDTVARLTARTLERVLEEENRLAELTP